MDALIKVFSLSRKEKKKVLNIFFFLTKSTKYLSNKKDTNFSPPKKKTHISIEALKAAIDKISWLDLFILAYLVKFKSGSKQRCL